LLFKIFIENRENSYNRSRSSSISSIDKDSKEAITALYFMESFARKNDSTISPCLFVGTSLGMVLVISLNLPSADEQRFTEPVIVFPSGKSFYSFPHCYFLKKFRYKELINLLLWNKYYEPKSSVY
jgi:hypothetical protein